GLWPLHHRRRFRARLRPRRTGRRRQRRPRLGAAPRRRHDRGRRHAPRLGLGTGRRRRGPAFDDGRGADGARGDRLHAAPGPLRDACVAATWPDPTRTPRAPAKKPRPEEVLLHVWLTDGERLWLRRRPTGLLGDRPAPWALDWPAAGAPTRLETELGPAVLEA